MDERKQDASRQRERETEDRTEPLEDLDVPDRDDEDVKGGYSIINAWPKKYSG